MPDAKKSVKKTSPKRRKRPTKTSPKRRGRPTKTSPKRRGRPTRRRMNAPGDDEKTNEELLAEVADLREEKARALEALRRLLADIRRIHAELEKEEEPENHDFDLYKYHADDIAHIPGVIEDIIDELEKQI